MNHREKVRMARRMMTKLERELHTSPFQCSAWTERKEAIARRAKKREQLSA